MTLNAEYLIKALRLEAHVEGGYFRRTFQADHREKISTENGGRFTMTSIYYMLTNDSTKGYFHMNTPDIAHFYHSGAASQYYLISPEGKLKTMTLGPNIDAGERFQFVVPGGWWKASEILASEEFDFSLISEAVAPGFEYSDMTLGERSSLKKQFPGHAELIRMFTRVT